MPHRRLAAIMFADIAGYTAMMQRNEQMGLARVCVQRFVEVVRARGDAHSGEVVDVRGDGSLCVFPSAVDALYCAKAIQQELQAEPSVPLRIGIHLGNIVLQDGTVYEDGVNLASRVESIAVPGSVMLTEQVAAQLKSHPELPLRSMGTFHFKNVEEPMEVLALANDGLAVPLRSQLKGKLEQPARKRWVLPAAGALLVLVPAVIWWMNKGGNLLRESIPEALRTERIAVMAFENQTADAQLDAFGRMISDWLIKGLMDTEEAQVVSAANIQAQVQLAGFRNLDRPAVFDSDPFLKPLKEYPPFRELIEPKG
jgi:class 3 adenylate cyclase